MYNQIASNKRKTVYLLFGFFALIGGLAWIFSAALEDQSIFFLTGIVSLLYVLVTYFASSKMALAITGAKEVTKAQEPRLYRIVENLAITEGMPTPKVYVIEDAGLNAFATGRDPQHASVAITTGLLTALEDSELQGVMAHELGHVKNYDIRVSTIAFALVGVVSLLCDMFLRISFWGGSKDDNNNNSSNGILIILAIVAMVLAPLVATLLQLSLSRKREYLADATGALTTRYPEGLARALEKIRDGGSVVKRQNSSTAHFFIANPLKGKSLSGLMSTHPPIDERIRILRNMTESK